MRLLNIKQIRIPNTVSFEEAATWPPDTVGEGMYSHDGLLLPWPNNPSKDNFPVLIYGASNNIGLWAVQYAELSGLRVLATCSENNFEAVKQLGADEHFDYRDEKWGENIKAATNRQLKYAFDCVSEGNSKDVSSNLKGSVWMHK